MPAVPDPGDVYAAARPGRLSPVVRGFPARVYVPDSRDDTAQAMASRLDQDEARLNALRARLTAWIGSLGAHPMIAASVIAADHAWPLVKAETRARHQMTDAEEDLAAALATTGSGAGARRTSAKKGCSGSALLRLRCRTMAMRAPAPASRRRKRKRRDIGGAP